MDSLLANYASSSDEEGESEPQTQSKSSVPPKPSSLTVHLPPPNSTTTTSSSSLFSSLPPPKPSKSTLFSTLPPPKPQPPQKPSPLAPNPKKTIQFTLPINPSVLDADDDDDEDEQKKPIKDLSSSAAPKALSSMLPAPKNSLCLAPAASRKSIVESQPQAQLPISEAESFPIEEERSGLESYGGHGGEEGVSEHENYGGYNSEGSGWEARYGGGEEYGGYRGSWMDGNVVVAPSPAPEVYDIGRIAGKRGRNEIPTEILEVKQDELLKNRPREDQVKLTGIAFGPAYQPVSTSKGKPSKLHKRKHQIGSLYFDTRQKETELAERRARGFLTKAETQAKYGW